MSFPYLAGLRFTPDGLDVVPSLPKELGAYSFVSPLASIVYDGAKRFSGHWAPHIDPSAEPVLQVRFDLSAVVESWNVERHETVAQGRVEFSVTLG